MHTHDKNRRTACQGDLVNGRCRYVERHTIHGFDAPRIRDITGPAWELEVADKYGNLRPTGRMVTTDRW